MWDIWRFIIPSWRWSYWSYYLYSYCRIGKQNKEVSIIKLTFKWDYVIGRSVAMLIWIGLWTKLRIYRVPPDPIRWSCRDFGFLWRSFILDCMLWTKNNLKVSHRKQVNAPSHMKMVTYLINFQCKPWGIFECLLYHQEDEVIDPIIFAATAGLGTE